MTIIDRNGERPVCDRWHKVRVKIRRGSVCEDCREVDRHEQAEVKELVDWARRYTA